MTRVPSSVLTIFATNRAIARVMGASRRQILTTLFLALPLDALDLIGWYRREMVSGRFSSDPAIVFSLFRAIDRKGKIDLITSFCGSSLDTPHFVKLISQVYRTCSPNGAERDCLAETISRHASVYWNISNPGYEELVRKLLASRRTRERMHGLLCLESLEKVPPDLCLRLAQLVRDRVPYVRANAWSGAHMLLDRGRLTAEAHELLVRESLAAIKDKDKFVRGNARLFRRRSQSGPPPDRRGRRGRGAQHGAMAGSRVV